MWVFIIGSICGILSNRNPVRVDYENNMDALNLMLREQGVDSDLCLALRDSLREKQHHDSLCRSRAISDSFSPVLQAKLIPQILIGKCIRAIWYFHDADERFIVEVSAALVPKQYSHQDRIGRIGTLSIVQRGAVARNGRVLCPGCVWGEDMILSDQELIDPTQGIALNYVEVLTLSKLQLDQILVADPRMKSHIKKAAAWINFKLVLKAMAERRKEEENQAGSIGGMLDKFQSSHSLRLFSTCKDARQRKSHFLLNSDEKEITNVNRPVKPIEETRSTTPLTIQDLGSQIAGEFKTVIAEINNVKEKMNNMKDELQIEVNNVKGKMENMKEELRSDVNSVKEELRSELNKLQKVVPSTIKDKPMSLL